MTLKRLIKKFSYEIVHESLFKEHAEEGGQRHLTASAKQGIENLLVNLKKSIEKDKKRKLEEQTAGKTNKSMVNDDLVSIYTTNKSVISGAPTNYNEVEDLLKDSDDDEHDKVEADARSKQTNKSSRRERKQSILLKFTLTIFLSLLQK